MSGTFEVFGPEITSFSPTSGIPGSVITINGKGFSPDTWSTKVRFGTVEASSITSLTETQIKVLVPSGATAGAMKINVETNGQIVTSKDDFTVKNQ
ncbi:IPT/TIG domain-containing protein [Parapedobacter pyrenivorans]|uniref:IPT/TIG domain-containing protein n=1 Tax=Parapedobacter pyrenivorans TaxID=1305674 RepID=UPI003340BFA8